MNVSSLQQFLHSLATALETTQAGQQSAREVKKVCAGLEPFRALEFDAFAGFLARCDDYQRNGAVAPAAAFDLNGLRATLRQLDHVRSHATEAAADTTFSEIFRAQHELSQELGRLADATGLKWTLKSNAKWVNQQIIEIRVRTHAAALRALAARITGQDAFAIDDVRTELRRLDQAISATEWKILAAEFAVSPSLKGAKRIEAVLARLSGHQPPKATAQRKKGTAAVDLAKVAEHAGRLHQLLERAKTEAQISADEVGAELELLKALNRQELIDVANQCGFEKPGKSKKEVLSKIERRLSAGRRVMEQTAQ
jgi:hypothetical protein